MRYNVILPPGTCIQGLYGRMAQQKAASGEQVSYKTEVRLVLFPCVYMYICTCAHWEGEYQLVQFAIINNGIHLRL